MTEDRVDGSRDWLDRIGIGLSGLCLVHCVLSAILVAAVASASEVLLDPSIHKFGLAFALAIALVAFGRGLLRHGAMLPLAIGGTGIGMMALAIVAPHGAIEMGFTMAGVLLLAIGHELNRRRARR